MVSEAYPYDASHPSVREVGWPSSQLLLMHVPLGGLLDGSLVACCMHLLACITLSRVSGLGAAGCGGAHQV